ncbi:MAG TPA: TRAP transporter large permease subunit [Ktedonosporobacter sp.]|nr:TRAP transporter large permease subunit [Ktedonosporobacter sp.]
MEMPQNEKSAHANLAAGPPQGLADRIAWYFRRVVEIAAALLLAVDLVVVFVSVIFRYFLHNPLQWSDEVAQMLLVGITFLGGAAALSRGEHLGVMAVRVRLSARWQDILHALGNWIIAAVAVSLCWSAISLLPTLFLQLTSSGLSESLFFFPVIGGAAAMVVFAITSLLKTSWRAIWMAGLALLLCALLWFLLWLTLPYFLPDPIVLLLLGFLVCLLSGIPIAFSLAFAALIFIWTDGTLPIMIYSQQIESGINNFVLLAVPFFIMAGLTMDVNGMSARLIGMLQLLLGRIRGGLQVVMIASMALFSGISGSKMADVAAVGSLLIPAIRDDRQDVGDAVALLASTAVMGETIPPCINIIILGSVANISIGGLFAAGILPAIVMASALVLVAILAGSRKIVRSTITVGSDVPVGTAAETTAGAVLSSLSVGSDIVVGPVVGTAAASPSFHETTKKAPLSSQSLIIGTALTLVMMVIIFGGILGGIATPTEVSAFAVGYALLAGGLAFRQLTPRSLVKLFVDSASMAGMVLFIVAAAQMVAYILTVQQVPQTLATFMTSLAGSYGNGVFLLASALILIVMGSVLEGAPALIIFGPLLIPIAEQLGIQPLHFGIIMIIAMGLGLFAPPLGMGIYTACAVGGVSLEQVARPSFKYLAIIFVTLLIIMFVPWITLSLPHVLGVGQ